MLADWQGPAGSQATFKRQVATASTRCKTPMHPAVAWVGHPPLQAIESHGKAIVGSAGVGEDAARPAPEGVETGPLRRAGTK